MDAAAAAAAAAFVALCEDVPWNGRLLPALPPSAADPSLRKALSYERLMLDGCIPAAAWEAAAAAIATAWCCDG